MLTQAELKEVLSYDPENGNFTWLVAKSPRVKVGGIAGSVRARRGKKYIVIKIKLKNYYAHRLAFLYMNGEMPPYEVDHISGDGTDNLWLNLRLATTQENQRNVRLRDDNTSGCTGVYWNKTLNKWRALIGINGNKKYLGYFADLADAIAARQAANIEYGFHVNHGSDRPL